ncbi:MAG TPA: long-chain fatty acid--CoA ligase, partial [Novosphingobium sp.]|nr:long-chain fatty acid--CoA ligase [Novosphingobium sp.]
DARIGILMTNRPEWVCAFFGAGLAGGTAVGLSTFSTPEELAHLIRASGISHLLLEGQVLAHDFHAALLALEPAIATAAPGGLHAPAFPHLRRLVRVDPGATGGAVESLDAFLVHGAGVPAELVRARAASVTPADPGVLFFSSGSTGKPKGILSAHRGVCIQGWRWKRIYGLDESVRAWSANGLFWSGNFASTLAAVLASGGCQVLQRTFDPSQAIRLMEAERVNFPYAWPHQWASLEAAPEWQEADLSAMRWLDCGTNLRRPQPTITTTFRDPRESYGNTEMFTIATSYPCDAPVEPRQGTFGEALPGNTIRVVDPATGQTLNRGETGEFACKGPTLMLGYIGVPRDETLDDQGFYRCGDGGYMDEAGRFVFQGRINDIIKTGGANVSPVEVDWSLCSCPGVKVCKTTGVRHETLGEMVVSCVVAEAGHALDEAAIIAWLKQRLASYKVPRRVVFVDEADLGLTGTAKIRPDEVRALAARKLAESA